MAVQVKRAYEPRDAADGYRVLVDRLWPRGLAKAEADIDEWAKDLAPSTELRRWYGHDPQKFAEFRERYLDELAGASESLARLRTRAHGHRLTLLTATRDLDLSQAAVLADLIAAHPGR